MKKMPSWTLPELVPRFDVKTNDYGASKHMTSSSNLPYSLTPGESNENQNGSEPAYAGGWVHKN